MTPLKAACKGGNADIIRLLLSQPDIGINHGESGGTALYKACEQGHEEIVELLLEHPEIDVNKGNR
eukprot:CAMPEP_0206203294 /NCGR_PEP_ID=MMETSP0166-20121206/12747_1 /ASSEMBLY_ACC=CAM_ASM_000260 /TAXON_ID=95228 /ORGANISM="Vannella robusta, Strain DIVA3 518/3/11/1/6" /LENGTH=65 /DNA_ID=CAMNT_0053622511 /DNA_START=65 /DNA_END=259 /DNA_ORIENTATION=-